MHKEVQQPTSGPTSLGVTSEVRADPQLSSVVLASLTEPVFSASTIVHFKSASGHDASVNFTVEADPGKYVSKESLSQQQGNDEGTQNYSFDHIFVDQAGGSVKAGEGCNSVREERGRSRLKSELRESLREMDDVDASGL
ncbi:hypothetical protein Tco_0705980 [Tanacetum coccineum]|uniref:Uncharacterized protein n=1 Tax=Tanacetum coccineum TaxID=301880 RepID=A0ABQ4Y631_9ASTR